MTRVKSIVLATLLFGSGLVAGNFQSIKYFFSYSCQGFQFLLSDSDYEKQAVIAVFQEHPAARRLSSRLDVQSTKKLESSMPDMFPSAMLVDVGLSESFREVLDDGRRAFRREITEVFTVHVDGCGKTKFQS